MKIFGSKRLVLNDSSAVICSSICLLIYDYVFSWYIYWHSCVQFWKLSTHTITMCFKYAPLACISLLTKFLILSFMINGTHFWSSIQLVITCNFINAVISDLFTIAYMVMQAHMVMQAAPLATWRHLSWASLWWPFCSPLVCCCRQPSHTWTAAENSVNS